MTRFGVWAPLAARVELVTGEAARARVAPGAGAVGTPGCEPPRPMRRGEHGWWALDAPDLGPGTDYAFRLDGDGPYPDPRSPWQPEGVHGPSRVVDHAAFPWTDAGFRAPPLESGLLYELHVGTFSETGTFDGVVEHLDALVELGVTHVELLPVAEFPGSRGWGYDGVDLYAPHHAYGGPDGLRRLVDACHASGLAVVLDVVYNHLGPAGNHLPRFGPYFTPRYRTPWGEAFNFDGRGSDHVRAFVVDNALLWLRDYHVDGLRLDAVHEIFDRSAVHVLEELAAACHRAAEAAGRPFVVIAESDLNDPRLVWSVERGGYGLDAQWNDDLRHALHTALTGEADRFHAQYRGLPDLAAALERVFVFDGRYSPFRERRHGRPVGDVPATRFVAFLQNHDQAGNRALGERSSQLMDEASLRVGAAVVLLGPFVPLLFAGEEWAASTPFLYVTDHQDPELAEAVRMGRRREFAALVADPAEIPDPQDPTTFDRSRLRWEERLDGQHARLLAWHRELLAFRRAHPVLADGSLPAVRWDAAGWLTMATGEVLVAINLAEGPIRAPLGGAHRRLALASDDGVTLDGREVRLPRRSVAVLVHDADRRAPLRPQAGAAQACARPTRRATGAPGSAGGRRGRASTPRP